MASALPLPFQYVIVTLVGLGNDFGFVFVERNLSTVYTTVAVMRAVERISFVLSFIIMFGMVWVQVNFCYTVVGWFFDFLILIHEKKVILKLYNGFFILKNPLYTCVAI